MCNTFLINSNWLDKCNIAGILVLFIMSFSQVEQDYRMNALTYTVDALILFVVFIGQQDDGAPELFMIIALIIEFFIVGLYDAIDGFHANRDYRDCYFNFNC